ncbi:hypothetical protein [Streptomyces exfoliatus]|uniref:hypothetical protein n=1 Tax=Streptomyces exfoliatus TaxID=1905 RepID=UPI0037B88FB9
MALDSLLSEPPRNGRVWIAGAEVIGFDNRLKSPDSLNRKVATFLKEHPGQSAAAALATLSDAVRYTLQWRDDQWCAGETGAVSTADLPEPGARGPRATTAVKPAAVGDWTAAPPPPAPAGHLEFRLARRRLGSDPIGSGRAEHRPAARRPWS